jgi:hypothetical protein
MTEVYTTTDLVRILAEEHRACVNGRRLNLSASVSGVNPLIDQFLNPEGIQKFSAYQDFRAAVHDYQRQHQVSGILWRQVTCAGQALIYPQVAEELIALPEDQQLLHQYRFQIYQFWLQQATTRDVYLSVNWGKDYLRIDLSEVESIFDRSEWANLEQQCYSGFSELILQLGWGEPREARYHRGWPEPGSEFINAITPGYAPIP